MCISWWISHPARASQPDFLAKDKCATYIQRVLLIINWFIFVNKHQGRVLLLLKIIRLLFYKRSFFLWISQCMKFQTPLSLLLFQRNIFNKKYYSFQCSYTFVKSIYGRVVLSVTNIKVVGFFNWKKTYLVRHYVDSDYLHLKSPYLRMALDYTIIKHWSE